MYNRLLFKNNRATINLSRAANRVMKSITKYIENTLKLKVNTEKSKVERPWCCKFLGYSFYRSKGGIKIRTHEKLINKLKGKLRNLTSRSKIGNIKTTYEKIKQLAVGWINFFKLADMKKTMSRID